MSSIEENLAFILSSRYGEDVRQAIHDAIHDCYEDGKAGAIDLVAREQIANLVANAGSAEKDSELVDIRVGKNGITYDSAGEAVRYMMGAGPTITSTSELEKLEKAMPNTIYLIGYGYTDRPDDIPLEAAYNGTLMTFNHNPEVNDGTVQIYASNKKDEFYIRSTWNDEESFGSWHRFGFEQNKYKELLSTTGFRFYFISVGEEPETPYDSADTFPTPSIIAGEFVNIINAPSTYGLILTFGEDFPIGSVLYGHAAFQICIGTDYKLNYRLFWNTTWSAWKEVGSFEDINAVVEKIERISSYIIGAPSISMFENIGVIGDSYASGGMVINEEIITNYNISWPQVLKRSSGVDFVNYSIAGATCQTWLTDPSYGKSKLLNDNAKQLYLICLGINDADRTETQPTGTIADMKINSDENPDTFFGNYGKILSAIMSKSEKSKIVLVTIPLKNAQYVEYSGYIKDIGEKYNLPVIDSLSDPYLSSDDFQNNRPGGHPLSVKYSKMANSMKQLIEKIMLDPYFNDYTGTLS